MSEQRKQDNIPDMRNNLFSVGVEEKWKNRVKDYLKKKKKKDKAVVANY